MSRLRKLVWIVLPIALCGEALSAPPLPRRPATPPSRAAETLRLQSGFHAELVASEPLITDPVAMAYDEDGRAYVVEMNDYPYSDKSHDQSWSEQTSEPIGRIRLLEDTDDDGQFDRSTVFADRLSWPAGLALWKGGVYVAATPDVLYLKDTDGDGRADIRRQVFTGFRKYNVQAVMNNLHWGLDHHIYAAGSSNGGSIRRGPDDAPAVMRRHDFRFQPEREQFELISGGARFGNTFDDWGNRFLCNIRNPVQQVVLPAHYLQRNPQLPVTSALHDAAEAGDSIAVYQISPPEPWRVINALRQSADAATNPPHDSTVASGFVTSSSGITIYRGTAYPREFRGNAFIGEVAGNLVMRYRLHPNGVTFDAQPTYDGVNFLASTDNWFRPVNFVNAPDGTLHVLDMYRETIEHPWSMPDDLKARVDLTSGRNRGRIYRLVPDRFADDFSPPPKPRLSTTSTVELVSLLENPNSWWRETAHRLIYERQDRSAVVPLRKLLQTSAVPVGRLHALWSLAGLQSLTDQDLLVAMSDDHAEIRAQGVLLSEPRLAGRPAIRMAVLRSAADDAIRVRFQVAFTLGELPASEAAPLLFRIVRRDASDPWLRTAALSSITDSGFSLLEELLIDREFARSEDARGLIAQLTRMVTSHGNPTELNRVLDLAAAIVDDSDSGRQFAQLIVAAVGAGKNRSPEGLPGLARSLSPAGKQLIQQTLSDAANAAVDTSRQPADRVRAIELLTHDASATVIPRLSGVLEPREPPEVQQAAVLALTSFTESEIAALLIERYPALTPDVRNQAILRLLLRQDWLLTVLRAMDQGTIPPTHVSWVRRDLYLKHPDQSVRELAVKLFASERPSPRAEVVAGYQQALLLPTDVERGAAIFRRECTTCHRLGNQGTDVGPNLATIRHRSPAELLLHILDPNREVSPNYMEYIVVTSEGLTHTGIITSETANSVTLLQPEGKRLTILRSRIDEIQSSQKSLMPEGLEKKLQPQDVADVIAFLKDAPAIPAGSRTQDSDGK